ncbi:hypothetical protein [Streptomyces sp. NPDC089799]|uniref:hypothetical protein n=1 Tax=Streptomyces sp. NPDC089799 TaxID=3155066 RepID=UPI0034356C07
MFHAWGRTGRLTRALGVSVAGLGLAVAGGLLTAAPAQAAQAREVPEATAGGCAGRLVRTLPFSTGEVRVFKSRTHVCAMTLPYRTGVRQHMSVSVQPRGGVPVADRGRFTRFAGPVTVYAVSRCVFVRGEVGAGSVSSGWILC